MKPLVKTLAGTALLAMTVAGCASKSTGGTAAAGAGGSATTPSAGQTGATPGGTSSGPASGSGGTTATSPSTPASPGGSAKPGGGTETPPPAGTTKITSPQGVALEADGQTLAAAVEWGGCNDQPKLVVVSQDGSKVVVELATTSHYKVGMMCPNIQREGTATVKLAAPLGGRQLVDGVTHAVIPVH